MLSLEVLFAFDGHPDRYAGPGRSADRLLRRRTGDQADVRSISPSRKLIRDGVAAGPSLMPVTGRGRERMGEDGRGGSDGQKCQ